MDEQEQEQEFIEHFIHEHPLKRIPNVAEDMSRSYWCYGCYRDFVHGDAGYGCSVDCGSRHCLHEECAEMMREIRHSVHPSHPLTQVDYSESDVEFIRNTKCSVCDLPHGVLGWLIYICSMGCEMFIHSGCVGSIIRADDDKVMNHPSHPQHQLRFLNRSCPFKCDACGTARKGKSYICSICQYWIHESCATLPTTAFFHHLHPDHSLSLSFTLPVEYIQYNYTCGICSESLPLTHWVYHCQLCRFVVHIKCATITSTVATSNLIKDENAADDEQRDIFKCPMNNVYEEMIRPFVNRERGKILIPHDANKIITAYKFHEHHRSLSFTAFSSLQPSHDNSNEEDDDDDDDDEISELTCDGCAMTIEQKPSTSCCSSSSSSYSNESGYMSCGECQFFLHLSCFNLPLNLTSHHLHQDHHLYLENSKKTRFNWCDICDQRTNGLFYACPERGFKIDIKCISLPNTIKHAGHPHHVLKLYTIGPGRCRSCFVCERERESLYQCDKCVFRVCYGCVLLPASNKHRLENHVLPLTFDASVNHPDEFYCANCETEMNPKSWTYHCRQCDQSFHSRCSPATSGYYRNVNFGRQQYQVSHHPQHPLRFQLVFKKKRCDVCRDEVYDHPGYQCISCNFVMCWWHHDDGE